MGFFRNKASMAKSIIQSIAIVALILLLSSKSSDAGDPSTQTAPNANGPGTLALIKNYFFPRIEITLYNEDDNDVLFTCNLTPNSTSLYVLRKGDKYKYSFTQVAFPMRWCYLYVNDKVNGFFWSYNVRLRCTKCFWMIKKYPLLYRSDRTRWERQQLFMPRDFDISQFKRYNASSS